MKQFLLSISLLFTGVIEKVDNDKKKVTVTVKVFGRSTGLDLGFMQVEKE